MIAPNPTNPHDETPAPRNRTIQFTGMPYTPASPTIHSLLPDYTAHLTAAGKSPLTIKAYLADIHHIANLLTTPLASITSSTLEHLLTTESTTGTSHATLYRLKASLRSFFAWAVRAGHAPLNPAFDIRMKRPPRPMPTYLSESEQGRLLREVRDRTSEDARRDRVIIELFLGTGIRLAELVALDIADVDLETKHLSVRHAKGDIPTVKFLKSDLRTLLRSYLTERKRRGVVATPALFTSYRKTRISARQIERRLAYWFQKAGITRPGLTPHSLRHTFATNLYKASDSSLLTVQRALGHAQITTTQIYTHLSDTDMEEAMERL